MSTDTPDTMPAESERPTLKVVSINPRAADGKPGRSGDEIAEIDFIDSMNRLTAQVRGIVQLVRSNAQVDASGFRSRPDFIVNALWAASDLLGEQEHLIECFSDQRHERQKK